MPLRIVALLLVLVLAACNRAASVTPVSPTPVLPPPAQNFYGYVGDTVFHPVADARIEVIDGPLAGSAMTTTAQGRFFYPAAMSSPITFRATKDGYLPATQTARSNGGNTLLATFQLDAVAPPVNIAGDYTLTFIADSACADQLPIDARTRTYAATVTPQPSAAGGAGTHLLLTASGSNPLTLNSFPIGVAGNQVALLLFNDEEPGLIESIDVKTFLMFAGQADTVGAASTPASLTFSFNGAIDSCVVTSEGRGYGDCYYAERSAHQLCASKDHQVILTRR